jgi:hypothetical protein
MSQLVAPGAHGGRALVRRAHPFVLAEHGSYSGTLLSHKWYALAPGRKRGDQVARVYDLPTPGGPSITNATVLLDRAVVSAGDTVDAVD